MYKILRMIFCILTCALVAAAIFVFVYAGWLWGLFIVLLAVICGCLMLLFRTLQIRKDYIDNPPPPKGDFITGRVPKDDNKENK